MPSGIKPVSVPAALARRPVLTTRLVHVLQESRIRVIPACPDYPEPAQEHPIRRIIWIHSESEHKSNIVRSLDIPMTLVDAPSARTAIRESQIVVFRAADEYAPEWLCICLYQGRIPIVVGNAVTLPLAGQVDYSEAIHVLGEEPVELRMLMEFASLPDTNLRRMASRCRTIWDRYYSPDSLRKVGLAITARQTLGLSEHSDIDTAIGPKNPFPAFTSNGQLIRESDLFRAMWLQLGRKFPPLKSKPILCWGAGRFLRRLLDGVKGMRHGPALIGIVDDHAADGQTLGQWPVRTPSQYAAGNFAAVLVATDSQENVLAQRCRTAYGKNVRILYPSRLMAMTSDLAAHGTGTAIEEGAVAGEVRLSVKATPPRKLEAVMVCVGYSDMLSWTLRWNRQQFDHIAVVTSQEDTETQRIAKANDARLVISDRYRDGAAGFNKGRMLNDGFAALDFDDWVMITDADILFSAGLRQRLLQRTLHRQCLYYATRLDAPADGLEDWLAAFESNPDLINDLPFREPGRNRMPWGYFQLVNPSADTLRGKGRRIYGEEFGTACDVDYGFQEQWRDDMKLLLPELTVHIPHGQEGINWSGRQSPPLRRPAVTKPLV